MVVTTNSDDVRTAPHGAERAERADRGAELGGGDEGAGEVERLAAEGDETGVATWGSIAERYRQLRDKTRAN